MRHMVSTHQGMTVTCVELKISDTSTSEKSYLIGYSTVNDSRRNSKSYLLSCVCLRPDVEF